MKTIIRITAVAAAALSLAACDENLGDEVQEEGREDEAIVASESPTTTTGNLTTPSETNFPSTQTEERPDPDAIKVSEAEITNPENEAR